MSDKVSPQEFSTFYMRCVHGACDDQAKIIDGRIRYNI